MLFRSKDLFEKDGYFGEVSEFEDAQRAAIEARKARAAMTFGVGSPNWTSTWATASALRPAAVSGRSIFTSAMPLPRV